MRLEARPALGEAELALVEQALARTGLLGASPHATLTPWRRAALRDDLEEASADIPPAAAPGAQARSPRSTPGATRA